MNLLNRRKSVLVLLVLYWLTIFILTHIPLRNIPYWILQANVSDKALHFLAYLLLCFLLSLVITPNRKVRWSKPYVWWILLALAWYGAFDEWLQSYVGRNCSIWDFAADLAGALSALVLLSIFSFWPAMIISTAVFIFALTNLTKLDLAAVFPRISILFHLLSYAFFTLLWVQYIHRTHPPGKSFSKNLILSVTIPAAFLSAVKIVSGFAGKAYRLQDIIIAAAAIIAVFVTYYITVLHSRRIAKKTSRKKQDA